MTYLTEQDFELPPLPIKADGQSIDLESEISTIGLEFTAGKLITKRALARVARLIIEEAYVGVEMENQLYGGRVIFAQREEFLDYITKLYNISKSDANWQISRYKELVSELHMSWEAAFKAVLKCPMTLNYLGDVVEFEDKTRRIVNVNLAKARALPHPNPEQYNQELTRLSQEGDTQGLIDLIREPMATMVEEASELNGKYAAKMVQERLGRNSILFIRNPWPGQFNAVATERAVNEHGEVEDLGEIEIRWVPYVRKKVREDGEHKGAWVRATLPMWVVDKTAKKLGAAE